MNEQLPGGHFAASNISHYLSGRSRPRLAIQDAIERAVASSGSPGEQPLTKPAARSTLVQDTVPPLHVEGPGDGRARLVINRHLPWPDVLQVLDFSSWATVAGPQGTTHPHARIIPRDNGPSCRRDVALGAKNALYREPAGEVVDRLLESAVVVPSVKHAEPRPATGRECSLLLNALIRHMQKGAQIVPQCSDIWPCRGA